MALTKEQSIRQAIAHEESLFAELAQKHKKSQARLDALKAKLAAMEPGPEVSSAQRHNPALMSPPLQKVKYPCFANYSVAGTMSFHCSG